MKRILLQDINIAGNNFDNLSLILDDSGSVVILPLLFSIHLETLGEVVRLNRYEMGDRIVTKLEPEPVSESTTRNYINHICKFLRHINSKHQKDPSHNISIHQTYLCTPKQVSEYINDDLIKTLTGNSLSNHQAALSAYFNFLAYMKLRKPHVIRVTRKARKQAIALNQPPTYINYVSTQERFELINICSCKRDKLILRCGYELGLRASEARGLLLENNGTRKGFLYELFEQLDAPSKCHEKSFLYKLPGQYAKRGKPRYLHISRDLLREMKDYYTTERASILSKIEQNAPTNLFIRRDPRGAGSPISKRLPSDLFNIYRKKLPYLDENLVYHDLRHTFATELFHEELKDNRGRETRSESAALLTVALRLGHALSRDGNVAPTTTRYIRLRDIMLIVEES